MYNLLFIFLFFKRQYYLVCVIFISYLLKRKRKELNKKRKRKVGFHIYSPKSADLGLFSSRNPEYIHQMCEILML